MQTYHLGGVTPVPWLSRGKVVGLVLLAMVGLIVMVLLVTYKNLVLVAVLFVLIAAFVVLARHRTSEGGFWLLHAGEGLRHAIGKRARWDDFEPELEDQPFMLMEPLRVIGVPSGEDGAELAVLEYPRAMVCVLEVSGSAHGVKEPAEVRRNEESTISLHRTLSEPKLCLEQLDWLTLVRPESPAALAEPFVGDLVEDLPGPVQEAMEALPDGLAARTERVRSYAIARFDVDALFSRVAQPPFTESSGAEAAYDALSQVARLLAGKGIRVICGLGPAEVSALMRAVLSPDEDPDDITGCEGGFWSAVPSWKRDSGTIVTAKGWHHATATFALDDWPLTPVQGRWLEPIVFGAHMGVRTIMTQVRLIPRYRARDFAKGQLTTAASRRYQKDKSGEIDAGEALSKEATAQQVARDVVLDGHVGIMPAVRVLCSTRTPRALGTAMETVENVATDKLNAESLSTDATRPGVGLLHCLPLGLEVPRR